MSLAMPVPVCLLLTCLVVVPIAARAQGAAPSCTTLLPAEVIAKVLGEPFKDLGDCDWAVGLGTPKARTLSMTFFDAAALKASSYTSADEYFETVVASVEARAPGKREMLPGVGMKAAFVATASQQMLVAVQRKDGVARMVGNNLTKAQMIALARAIAAP